MIYITILIVLTTIVIALGFALTVIQAMIAKEKTEGTIIDIHKKTFVDRTRLGYQETEIYLPVFEFYIDGKKYIKESVSGDSKGVYEIGKKVLVTYNKNNPEDAILEKDRKGKIIVAILLTVATLLGGGYVLMSYIK